VLQRGDATAVVAREETESRAGAEKPVRKLDDDAAKPLVLSSEAKRQAGAEERACKLDDNTTWRRRCCCRQRQKD